MNAKVKAFEVLGQTTVPAGVIVEALEIINKNASGVETSKKVVELFNSRIPSEVNSLANRWIYQAIVYTTDENYEALAENIEDIAERYFTLAIAGDMAKDFKTDFNATMGYEVAINDSTINATKGAEKSITWAHQLSNIIGMTEFGFNNNAELMKQIGKTVEQIDALLPDEVKTLETTGEVIVSEGYVSVRRKGVVGEGEENDFILATSETTVRLFNLLTPQ